MCGLKLSEKEKYMSAKYQEMIKQAEKEEEMMKKVCEGVRCYWKGLVFGLAFILILYTGVMKALEQKVSFVVQHLDGDTMLSNSKGSYLVDLEQIKYYIQEDGMVEGKLAFTYKEKTKLYLFDGKVVEVFKTNKKHRHR